MTFPFALLLAAAASFDADGGRGETQQLWNHLASARDDGSNAASASLGWDTDRGSAAAGAGGAQKTGSSVTGARLSLTFSKLASSALSAIAMNDGSAKDLARLVESLSIFGGQVCNVGTAPGRVSGARVAGALVARKVAVYSATDTQASIERARRRGRGTLSRLALGAVPVSAGAGAVASGLSATGAIRMSNGWAAGVTGASLLLGLFAGMGRDRAAAEQIAIAANGRTWLEEVQEQQLAPGACLQGLYFGSSYPAPLTISVLEE